MTMMNQGEDSLQAGAGAPAQPGSKGLNLGKTVSTLCMAGAEGQLLLLLLLLLLRALAVIWNTRHLDRTFPAVRGVLGCFFCP